MSTLIWLALGVPAAGAVVAGGARGAGWTRFLPLVAAATLLGCGAALVAATRAGGAVVAGAGLLRVDTFSAWFLTAVGAVALVAVWGGLPSRDQRSVVRDEGWFWALLSAFLAAMALALVADNLGLVWVAVEATTIATAFLVGYGRERQSLEAAWKYVVLGSVGVALAFLGHRAHLPRTQRHWQVHGHRGHGSRPGDPQAADAFPHQLEGGHRQPLQHRSARRPFTAPRSRRILP